MVHPKPRRRRWRSAARSSPQLTGSLHQLGDKVRSLRQAGGLTQEQAASAAHIDPKHWQAIEAGRVNITIATLLAVARALNVKLVDLLEGI